MTWHVCGAHLGGDLELKTPLWYRPLPDESHPLNRAELYGQRLLLEMQERNRRIPQASALAVSHVQEDLVRELPEA
jgi:hypothetical protein